MSHEIQLTQTTTKVKPEPKQYTGIIHHPYDHGAALLQSQVDKVITLGVSQGVTLSFKEDFLDQLRPDVAAFWHCYCCKSFFDKYATLLAQTYTLGEDGQVSDVRYVPAMWSITADTPEELIPAYQHLNAKLQDAKWVMPFCNELTKKDLAKGLTETYIGVKDRGGYQHWHFNPSHVRPLTAFGRTQSEVEAKLATLGTVFQKWLTTFKGSKETLTSEFQRVRTLMELDAKASKQVGEKMLSVDALEKALRLALDYGVKAAIPLLTSSDYNRLYHLSGSSIGRFLDLLIIEKKDAKLCLSEFVKMTDPEYYQRAQKEATDNDLKALKKMIVEKGYTNALNWSWCTPDDLVFVHDYRQAVTKVDAVGDSAVDAIDALLGQRKPAKAVDELSKALTVTYEQFFEKYGTRLTNVKFVSSVTNSRSLFTFAAKLNLSEGEPLPVKTADIAALSFYQLRTPVNPRFFGFMQNQTPKLIGAVRLPTANKTCFVVETTLTDEMAEVGSPLFAENYNSYFYPHRRALEELMAHVKPKGVVGDTIALIVPRFDRLQIEGLIDNVRVRFTLLSTDA